MAETVETLTKRLDQLEEIVGKITSQLAWLVNESDTNQQQDCETEIITQSYPASDKKEATRIINELLEKMGIADVEPIPIAEVRKSMAKRIRAEDNEFSRAIIAEREKECCSHQNTTSQSH